MAEKKDYILISRGFSDLHRMYGAKKVGKVIPALLKWGLDGEDASFDDPELEEIYKAGKLYIVKEG